MVGFMIKTGGSKSRGTVPLNFHSNLKGFLQISFYFITFTGSSAISAPQSLKHRKVPAAMQFFLLRRDSNAAEYRQLCNFF